MLLCFCFTFSLNIVYSINKNDIQHTYIVNIQRIRTNRVLFLEIWIFTVYQSTRFGVSGLQGVKLSSHKMLIILASIREFFARIAYPFNTPGPQIRMRNRFFSYFLRKTYVVGTQKNRLDETVLLSTQNTCLN